jgi:hypothetical protein
MTDNQARIMINQIRLRMGLILTLMGLFVFILGAVPDVFGLNRSPLIGFIQLAVLLIGLALICLGGYLSMAALWNGNEVSIGADFGLRLIATGYVIAVATAFADLLGFGTQPMPEIPCFGPWQERGVLLSELVIMIGFLLLIPWRKPGAQTDQLDGKALQISEHQDSSLHPMDRQTTPDIHLQIDEEKVA